MALNPSNLVPGAKVRVPAFAGTIDAVGTDGIVTIKDKLGRPVTIPVGRLERTIPYVNGNLYADRYGTIYEYSGYNDGGIQPGAWFEYDLSNGERKTDSYGDDDYEARDYEDPARPMRAVDLGNEVAEDDD
jgi:hypothetical protein